MNIFLTSLISRLPTLSFDRILLVCRNSRMAQTVFSCQTRHCAASAVNHFRFGEAAIDSLVNNLPWHAYARKRILYIGDSTMEEIALLNVVATNTTSTISSTCPNERSSMYRHFDSRYALFRWSASIILRWQLRLFPAV